MTDVQGFVYFVRRGKNGPIKIGYSRNPAVRIASMQTANEKQLLLMGTIPGDTAAERAIHRDLAEYRLRGEWVRPDPVVLRYVRHRIRAGAMLMPVAPEPPIRAPAPQINPVDRALAIVKTLGERVRQQRKDERQKMLRECAEWRKARNG